MVAAAVAASAFAGAAAVVDGDTVRVGSVRVRLHAVDAPELAQRCGQAPANVACGALAAAWLRARVEGRQLECIMVDRDHYNRIVARCRLGGADVGAALVEAGWATAYRKYGNDHVAAEARARAAGRGIWAFGFQQPEDYRRARTAALPQQAPPDTRCVVKGNVSSKGARIYHLPGSRNYKAVRISPAKGERWFCSAQQAVAAGWRLAG